MQVAMQQQLLQTGNQQSSPSKNSSQFSGQKQSPVDMPMMGPNNAAMMGMMPGGLPGMAGAQGMGAAGLGPDQQQFMQFQPFMPMMYPGAGGGMNFPANFQNKNEEKWEFNCSSVSCHKMDWVSSDIIILKVSIVKESKVNDKNL